MHASEYAKAIVGALIAGLTALAAAMADDGVTAQEWLAVLLAVLATGGGVYMKRNAPTTAARH